MALTLSNSYAAAIFIVSSKKKMDSELIYGSIDSKLKKKVN